MALCGLYGSLFMFSNIAQDQGDFTIREIIAKIETYLLDRFIASAVNDAKGL